MIKNIIPSQSIMQRNLKLKHNTNICAYVLIEQVIPDLLLHCGVLKFPISLFYIIINYILNDACFFWYELVHEAVLMKN